LTAFQELFDAQNQLTRAEGFGDVIIGAELQTQDAVHLSRSGSDHHDGDPRRPRVTPQRLAEEITRLASAPQKLVAMARAARQQGALDAAERLADLVQKTMRTAA